MVRPRTRTLTKTLATVVLLVTLAVLLSACVAGADPHTGRSGADGFWQGLWHGIISPVMFIVSLFRDDVGIYETHNSGGWYDFGFMLGVSIVFTGAGHSGGAPARQRQRRSPS